MDNIKYTHIINENEHRTHILLIDNTEQTSACHYSFYLKRNAMLVLELLVAYTPINLTIECILSDEGAHAHITGAYGAHNSDSVKIYTVQHHKAPRTHSTLMIRGIVCGNAYAEYDGTIRIEKNAHGTYASQENKNMIMSDTARAVSKPQLEVFTNDVHCSHGSATGRYDEEQLFYCAARGMDTKKAQQLLLRAFFGGLFTDETLHNKMNVLIEKNL